MDFGEYIAKVGSRFSGRGVVPINYGTTFQFYEERFEAKWFATQLKIYSFVAYSPSITGADIVRFSDSCTAYALNQYSGLPRGMQNGVASFTILAGDDISLEAISYAQARPKKHWAALEMPVVFDLANSRVFYYRKTPIVGAIYYSSLRRYIEENFNIR